MYSLLGGTALHTKWVGKAFKPLSDSSGRGYTIFEEKLKPAQESYDSVK